MPIKYLPYVEQCIALKPYINLNTSLWITYSAPATLLLSKIGDWLCYHPRTGLAKLRGRYQNRAKLHNYINITTVDMLPYSTLFLNVGGFICHIAFPYYFNRCIDIDYGNKNLERVGSSKCRLNVPSYWNHWKENRMPPMIVMYNLRSALDWLHVSMSYLNRDQPLPCSRALMDR